MPKKHDIEDVDPEMDDMDDLDDDPIPAKRDTRIFQIKKDKGSDDKDEDFEEDVFV